MIICPENVMLHFLFVYLGSTFGKMIGDKCENSNSGDGVCTLVTDCEVAISLIKNKKYHNNFTRCGFYDLTEIVCCPEASNKFGTTTETAQRQVTTSSSTRPAVRECAKITLWTPLDLHIIGGESASSGEFPHMVALGFDRGNGYEFDCGGSLVSNRFVLTAAHCIRTKDRIEPSIVRAGVIELDNNSWDDRTDFRVDEITTHPQYKTSQNYHDLALIRVNTDVEFSGNVNAACLYAEAYDPKIALTITGWGQTDAQRDARSNVLLKADVIVVDKGRCGENYKNWRKLPKGVTEEQLCAGDPEGKRDTCQGDSGGPLQGLTGKDNKYRIVGITSFGRGCGSAIPGVYTRVYHYIDWIESVVWPN